MSFVFIKILSQPNGEWFNISQDFQVEDDDKIYLYLIIKLNNIPKKISQTWSQIFDYKAAVVLNPA